MREAIPFALGLISGIVAAVSERFLERLFFRPKLEIVDVSSQPGPNVSGYAIWVRNKRGTTAIGCSGLVTIRNLKKDDTMDREEVVDLASLDIDPKLYAAESEPPVFCTPSRFRDVDGELLAWSRAGNPVALDIPPGMAVLLDLCRVVHRPVPQIHFPSELGWKALRAALKPGNYSIDIRAVASNARPANQAFYVLFDGTEVTVQKTK